MGAKRNGVVQKDQAGSSNLVKYDPNGVAISLMRMRRIATEFASETEYLLKQFNILAQERNAYKHKVHALDSQVIELEEELLQYRDDIEVTTQYCDVCGPNCTGGSEEDPLECFACGMTVCDGCSAVYDYASYGDQRICEDCAADLDLLISPEEENDETG